RSQHKNFPLDRFRSKSVLKKFCNFDKKATYQISFIWPDLFLSYRVHRLTDGRDSENVATPDSRCSS
ncbi:unnamed protein product, partial [Larinioides sclopetarius]